MGNSQIIGKTDAHSFEFIFIKPDAVVRGLVKDIISCLSNENIFVVDYKIISLSNEDISNLYNTTKPKYKSWWIMEKCYKLAPIVALLVIGHKLEFSSLAERVRNIIGPTNPHEGQESQVRYFLKGTHRIFNLIHASDDTDRALYESSVIFGSSKVESLLTKSTDEKANYQDNLVIEKIIREVDDSTRNSGFPIDIRMSAIRLHIKRSLLSSITIKDITEQSSEVDACLKRLESLVEAEEENVSLDMPLRKETKALQPIFINQRKVSSILPRMLSDSNRINLGLVRKWVLAFQAMTDDYSFFGLEFKDFLDALEFFNVQSNYIQRVVLESFWIGDFGSTFKQVITAPTK